VNQAWTISAVSEFDPDDRNGFFSNMYAGYNCAMTVICSLIIAFNMVLAKFLYANDFFAAWQYAPFLTVSIVFGALAGYIGGILAAVKDSKEFARSSIWGAVSNIALNLIMVPVIGPLGAAIATMACYWLTWFLRVRKLKKYINIRMRLARDYVSYAILVVQSIIFLAVPDLVVAHVIEAVLFAVIILLYRYEMQAVVRKGILFIKNR
jgi:O-antigen/teichoic acid export membrane protein